MLEVFPYRNRSVIAELQSPLGGSAGAQQAEPEMEPATFIQSFDNPSAQGVWAKQPRQRWSDCAQQYVNS